MQALDLRISIWTGVAISSLFSQNPSCSVEFATSHRCKPLREAGIFIRTESAYGKIKTSMRDLLCGISSSEPRRQTSLWNLFRRPVTLSSTSPQHRVSPVVKENELNGQVRRPISDEFRSSRASVNQWESRIPLPRNFSTRSCPGGSGTRQVTWSVWGWIKLRLQRFKVWSGSQEGVSALPQRVRVCAAEGSHSPLWVFVWPEVFRVNLLLARSHTSNPLEVRFGAALHHKGCCSGH